MQPTTRRRRDGAASRFPLLALTALAAAALLAACSGSAARIDTVGAPLPAASAAAAAAPADEAEGAGSTTRQYRAVSGADPAAATPRPDNALEGRLIIRTGSMSIEVANLEEALKKVEGIVAAAGGYIASGERSGTDDEATATITYRIPVSAFESTMAALHGIGNKLLSEQTSSDEVTSQVVDLDARITNLRATETALQKIMDQATKISDILEVQSQLTSVREQIEVLVAQKQGLEGRAAMSTLTVSFVLPPVVATKTVAQGWDPAKGVDQALATLVEFGQGLVDLGIWLVIVVLPIALLFGIPALVILLFYRRWRRRHPRRDSSTGPGSGTPGWALSPTADAADTPAAQVE